MEVETASPLGGGEVGLCTPHWALHESPAVTHVTALGAGRL